MHALRFRNKANGRIRKCINRAVKSIALNLRINRE